MRVGLNATCFDERPSGANQRFYCMYGALMRRHPEIEFFVYEPVDVPVARRFAGLPNVVARPTPVPAIGRFARLRAGRGFWRRRLTEDRLDLFEAFNLPLVVAPDCPTLFTIHDLRPILPGQPLAARALAALVTRHAFAAATHVITVSDVMRDAILAFRPGTAVTTIHNGVDADRFAAMPAGTALPAGVEPPFVLAVGHLEARKNLALLVDAAAVLRDRGRDVPMVIAGNDAGEGEALRRRILERGLDASVTIVSGASDQTIRALYDQCRLVAFPSRYEGFGIPLLEAMASGRPIAPSDLPVFREIMADRGGFYSPDDPSAAADVIERLWTDEQERDRLVAFGRARVRDFAFDTLADQIAGLYRTLT